MVQFDRQAWFSQHILVHEGRLRSYLRRFLKPHWEVADGIQETYARLLSLPDGALVDIRHPHAFLFTAARNVALEWTRRKRLVLRELATESRAASLLDDGPGPYDQLSAREDLSLLATAIARLPERCRQVLTLRKLYGLSQKEIAARLGISENTVEKHTANGVRLCADYFQSSGAALARFKREAHGERGLLPESLARSSASGSRGTRPMLWRTSGARAPEHSARGNQNFTRTPALQVRP